MKVVMPVMDGHSDTTVCPSFGRAPFFLVYDVDTNNSEFLVNNAAASQGGAGIRAAQAVVDLGADAVIVPRCGQNAADVIGAAGIKLYRSRGDSVQDNLKAFISGTLSPLEDIHPGFHNHGRG